jgi:hypothetical protein
MECSHFHILILEVEMFARLAQFIFVALTIVIGCQAGATPVIYGTYYDESASIGCSNAILCRVNFSQLPADKLLMVNQISCEISSGAAPVPQVNLLIAATFGGANLQRQYPLSFPPAILSSGSNFTNVQQNIHYLIGQGRFPFVVATASTPVNFSMTCTLVGDLVTPIQ